MKKYLLFLLLFLGLSIIVQSQTYRPQAYPMKSAWINHGDTWGEAASSESAANSFACSLRNARRNAVFMYINHEDLSDPDYVFQMQTIIRLCHYYRISVYAYYLDNSSGHFSDETTQTNPELNTDYIASRDAFINYMNNTTSSLHRFDGLVIGVEAWISSNWPSGNAARSTYLQNYYLNYVANFRDAIQVYINDSEWGGNFLYGGTVNYKWHRKSRETPSLTNGSYVLLTDDADNNGSSDYFDFVVPQAYCKEQDGKASIIASPEDDGTLEWITFRETQLGNGSHFWHAIEEGAKVVVGIAIGEKESSSGGITEYCLDPIYHDDVWDDPDNWNPNANTTSDGYEFFINHKLSDGYPGSQVFENNVLGTSIFPGRNLINLDIDPNKSQLERECMMIKNADADVEFEDNSNIDQKVNLIQTKANNIITNDIMESIKVYNISGQLVIEKFNTSYINMSGYNGIFLVHYYDSVKGINRTEKVMIK